VSPSPTPSPTCTGPTCTGVVGAVTTSPPRTTAVLLPAAEPPQPSIAALLRVRAVRRELSVRLA
jgi:hypothetical protein